MISLNDEHSSKPEFSITVTEEGIVICINDEHLKKEKFLIRVIEQGISNVIFVNDEHP